MLKIFVKKLFNLCGLDIIRKPKSPSYTLLGLRKLPIRAIIDIGANQGQFAKMVLDVFPDASLYCFEPLPAPFNKLRLWAEQQRNRKIVTYNVALGDSEGEAKFFNHINYSPSSSFLETTEICENLYPFTHAQSCTIVKVTTLDRWFENESPFLSQEILLKLDVQGFEDRVIRGGQDTFKKAKACIIEVSLDKLYKNQATFQNLSNSLYKFGYEYAGNLHQFYANDGHVIFIDAIFRRKN